ECLDLDDAGHHRQAREMTLEIPLARGDTFDPDDPLRPGVVLDDAVDKQERPAVRDQRFDLARRVDGFGHGRLQDGCGKSVWVVTTEACGAAGAGLHD